jgi:hypothetical protein
MFSDPLAAVTLQPPLTQPHQRNNSKASYCSLPPPSRLVTMDTSPPAEAAPSPPIFNYVLGFLIVGLAWGFTTPFIRRAAKSHTPPPHPILETPAVRNSWVKSKAYGAFFGVIDLLRNPRYAIPLVINLTGSIWFFLLIGQAGKFQYPFNLVLIKLRGAYFGRIYDCGALAFVFIINAQVD